MLVEMHSVRAQSRATEPGGRALSRTDVPAEAYYGGSIMEFHALPALSLPFVVQDILVAIGAGVALLAILVFLNLGLLLPGLLSSLGGPPPDQRGAYLEFGPAAGPLI